MTETGVSIETHRKWQMIAIVGGWYLSIFGYFCLFFGVKNKHWYFVVFGAITAMIGVLIIIVDSWFLSNMQEEEVKLNGER